MFKKIYCTLVCLIFICLLVGCKAQYLTINYKGNSYDLVYDWEMETDDYEIISVTEDNTNLNLRLYNNDINNEFVFCENTGSLYHNNKFKYPLNKSSNVSSLKFLSKEDKETYDRQVINEFITILSGQYENKIDVRDNLLTVAINYKD